MRFILSLILLAMAAFAAAQSSYDTHGKTEAQILSMGLEKWSDFYTEKEGSSTASMGEAAEIYGVVATHRTDKLLAAVPKSARQNQIRSLRSLLGKFAGNTVDVAYCESGGGTMYNPMWASVSGVVEDLLSDLISLKSKPKPMVTSRVSAQLAKIRRDIEGMHRDEKNNDFFKYADAKKAIDSLGSTYKAIVAVAKKMSRHDSDRVLGFCLDQAKNADIDWSK